MWQWRGAFSAASATSSPLAAMCLPAPIRCARRTSMRFLIDFALIFGNFDAAMQHNAPNPARFRALKGCA